MDLIKKLTAVLLSLAMVFIYTPALAFAAEDDPAEGPAAVSEEQAEADAKEKAAAADDAAPDAEDEADKEVQSEGKTQDGEADQAEDEESPAADTPLRSNNNEAVSISYEFADLNLVEGCDCELRDDGNGEWYYYNIYSRDGDVLTVNNIDYVYSYSEEREECGFESDTGDWIPDYEVSFDTNQDEEHWTAGDTVLITVSYSDSEYIVETVLKENPVHEISYEFAEPLNLTEGEDSYEASDFIYDEKADEYVEVKYDSYDVPRREGDRLIVNGVVYTLSQEDPGSEGEYVNESGDAIPYADVEMVTDQSYDNEWTPDNPGYITFKYMGVSSDPIKVEIQKNPVSEISYEFADLYLIEDKDGYVQDEEVYNEETGEKETKSYFSYHVQKGDGDVLTVNGIDYIYSDEGWEYVSDSGERIDGEDVLILTDQSAVNEWTPDNPGYAIITYKGRDCKVEVPVHENPVDSIEYEPAGPVYVVDGIGTSEENTEIYDEETDSYDFVSWDKYQTPDNAVSTGAKLTVHYTDGTSAIYTYNGELFADDEGAAPEYYESMDWYTDETYDHRWNAGSQGNLIFQYMGRKCSVPVEIRENPVQAISFARDGYDENNRIELIEKIDGDSYGDDYFRYDFCYKPGDVLTVSIKDGDEVKDVRYIAEQRDDEIEFINEEDPDDSILTFGYVESRRMRCSSDQEYESQWALGEDRAFTLKYMGRTCEVPVTIVPNDVVGIEYSRGESPVPLVEGVDGINSDGGDGTYFYYQLGVQQGDILKVSKQISGNIIDVLYTAKVIDENVVFVNNADPEDTIDPWDPYRGVSESSDQNDGARWGTGEAHTLIIEYMGIITEVPVVTVKGAVIESMSFSRDGYDDEHPIELTENEDGYFDEDEETGEGYFCYEIPYIDGDELHVKFDVSEDEVVYVFDSDTDWFTALGPVPEGAFDHIDINDLEQVTEQSLDNVWEAGKDYSITLDYDGYTTEVNVRVVAATHEHEFGDWVVSEDSTCTNTGRRTRTCTVCGFEEEEEIPMKDHTWSTEYTEDEPATCTEEGSESHHCTVCGVSDETSARAIPKKPHSYGDWEITEEATCIKAGSHKKICSVCGDEVTEEIPMKDHTWSEEFTVDRPATCKEEGSESQHCMVCDAVNEDSVRAIPKADHTFGEWEVVTPATCKEGSQKRVCSICGKTETEAIPAVDEHKWDAGKVTRKATTSAAGEKVLTCSVCKKTEKIAIPKVPAVTGTPKILNTVANSSRKTNDVIWDKSAVKNATNYELNWRARGASKWASAKVGNVTRGVTTGLTIGGLYEIRVTPYKAATATTAEVKGTSSAIVYRYFHTTGKIRLASNSKGTFTMSWAKNPSATGYQVLYTTNKNGSGAAQNIKTAGASATSITVRDIGITYIGNISCPVAVRVK